jgi:hypothetical protein
VSKNNQIHLNSLIGFWPTNINSGWGLAVNPVGFNHRVEHPSMLFRSEGMGMDESGLIGYVAPSGY